VRQDAILGGLFVRSMDDVIANTFCRLPQVVFILKESRVYKHAPKLAGEFSVWFSIYTCTIYEKKSSLPFIMLISKISAISLAVGF